MDHENGNLVILRFVQHGGVEVVDLVVVHGGVRHLGGKAMLIDCFAYGPVFLCSLVVANDVVRLLSSCFGNLDFGCDRMLHRQNLSIRVHSRVVDLSDVESWHWQYLCISQHSCCVATTIRICIYRS
jgi:hypothetical protein